VPHCNCHPKPVRGFLLSEHCGYGGTVLPVVVDAERKSGIGRHEIRACGTSMRVRYAKGNGNIYEDFNERMSDANYVKTGPTIGVRLICGDTGRSL